MLHRLTTDRVFQRAAELLPATFTQAQLADALTKVIDPLDTYLDIKAELFHACLDDLGEPTWTGATPC